jgi:hypothetical protein
MQVQLFSTKSLYGAAVYGYQSSSVKYYSPRQDPRQVIGSLYVKALRSRGKSFIDNDIAKRVVRSYYKTSAKNDHESNPENIATIASAIASQYNITKSRGISAKFSFRMPDFTSLAEGLEWLGEKILKVVKWGLGGIGVLAAFVAWTDQSAVFQGGGRLNTRGLINPTLTSLGIEPLGAGAPMAAAVVALGAFFASGAATPITKTVGETLKKVMVELKMLERYRITQLVYKNTDTYKDLQKAIKLIDKYGQSGETIPPKQSKQIAYLLNNVTIDAKNVSKVLPKLRKIANDADKLIIADAKKKEKEKKKSLMFGQYQY